MGGEFGRPLVLQFYFHFNYCEIIFTLPSIGFIIQLFYLNSSTLVLLSVSELEEGDSVMVLSLTGSLCHRI